MKNYYTIDQTEVTEKMLQRVLPKSDFIFIEVKTSDGYYLTSHLIECGSLIK